MFLVIKLGVYRHDILFCGDTEQGAKDAAEKLIMEERDDYHNMEIVESTKENPDRTVRVLTRKKNTIKWESK
jgi:hypothetical protein